MAVDDLAFPYVSVAPSETPASAANRQSAGESVDLNDTGDTPAARAERVASSEEPGDQTSPPLPEGHWFGQVGPVA